jgi:hypothetical protein
MTGGSDRSHIQDATVALGHGPRLSLKEGRENAGIQTVYFRTKVETPIHDSIRELITWECKEHGVKP